MFVYDLTFETMVPQLVQATAVAFAELAIQELRTRLRHSGLCNLRIGQGLNS